MQTLSAAARRRRPIAAAAAVLAVAGGLAAPAHAAPTDPKYVALGDSYSALPAIATAGPSADEKACARSTRNYPKQVATALGIGPEALRDNTCSGAKSENAFVSQHAGSKAQGYVDAAPQLTGIGAGTELVTLSLGGNDGDLFNTVVDKCAATSRSAPSPCTTDEATRPATLSDSAIRTRLDEITASDAAVIAAARERAPRARIVVVGYPVVFSSDATCEAISSYRSESIRWMRTVLTAGLNRALRAAADREHVEYIDLEPISRDHGVCSAAPWINGSTMVRDAFAMHPFPPEGDAVAAEVTRVVKAPARR